MSKTERNITRKDQASCYKKYRDYRRSMNIGITNCITVRVKKNLPSFLRQSKKYTWNWTQSASYRLFQIIIYKPKLHL